MKLRDREVSNLLEVRLGWSQDVNTGSLASDTLISMFYHSLILDQVKGMNHVLFSKFHFLDHNVLCFSQ